MEKKEIVKRLEEIISFYVENLKLEEEEQKDVDALKSAVEIVKESSRLEEENTKLKKENRGYITRLRNAERMGTYRKAAIR